MDRNRVVVAEIARPRGNRGELLARSQTDVPGRLQTLRAAQARLIDGSDVAVRIEQAWPHKEAWVLKLAGVDSINDAKRFQGADLWIPEDERARLPDGEYFQTDLIGCTVVDNVTGSAVGVVKAWHEYGGPPLMEVTEGCREVLIPFVEEICRVDLDRRTIRVQLPGGLLELNRAK